MPLKSPHRAHELRLLSLFRLFQATALAALVWSPLGATLIDQSWTALVRAVVSGYLVVCLGLLVIATSAPERRTAQVIVGAVIDLITVGVLIATMGGVASGMGALMMVSVAMSALLLPARLGASIAALAALIAIGQAAVAHWLDDTRPEQWMQTGIWGFGFFLIAGLVYWLSRQTRQSQDLAERREEDLSNLAEINELIIRRMRTGVLVVGYDGEILRFNESAWYLLGMPPAPERNLERIAPRLYYRLRHWLAAGKTDTAPMALAPGVPQVVPNFARAGAEDEAPSLIFLEDESAVSRRAEELTLSSLGRLSASIAHEVRNPLAAINHAAQLLAESEDLGDADKRLVEIITNHCARVNGIVENVLQLSRRERSRPEDLLLPPWLEQFLTEFKQALPPSSDQIRLQVERPDLRALVDPSQLTQALWNLLRNALRYGRQPDKPAEVLLRVRARESNLGAIIEVIDRGPGITGKVQQQLFQPFFTTRADGTGLGLYITKQLLEANQASIEYVPVPAGGACFRIQLTGPQAPPLRRSDKA